MTATDRALASANTPVLGPPVIGLASSVGTAAILLFNDLPNALVIRRLRVWNSHATQSLGLVLVPLGQAPGAQTVNDGYGIGPGATLSLPVQATSRVLLVGSGASTTFNATSSDI